MHNSIENFLTAEDGAGRLMAHARLLLKLAHIFADVVPAHLRDASQVANYRSGIVVIHAANGAVAAKLRQMGPTLANEFARRGLECSGVLVKVQAPESPSQSRTCEAKPLTEGARRELSGLQDRLPDSPLRSALATLLARSAKEK
ncbi:DciA family protein [Rhodocyclus purpureus]|uniref:DciA family protein n=1 Tax=Rhodocyclus purpureus TaxID=1067 RepID=UPI00191378EC|nr:DciA family protein [Rhodocyclus purpureus]MBK5913033.1 hypothetical protein [Rhodocyclus purpureus]